MSLWKKTDTTANRPKSIKLKPDGTIAQDASGKKLVLIDNQEAALPANKAKGITSPGWYLIKKKGNRVQAELLIALADAPRTVSGVVKDESDAAETSVDVGTDPV